MLTLRASILITLLGLSTQLVACSDGDDSHPESSVALDSNAIREIEALADRAVAAGIPGVSVAILRDEQTVTIARGVADRETGALLGSEHRFRMASIAKSVVASVVLQLVEEHRLALNDSVEKWLPGLLPNNGDASIEQLLRLESGIFDFARDERHMAPYLRGEWEHAWAPEELVALAADHPPDFAPGADWAYSNTNYTLLGMIVEKITGETLEGAVHARIVEPLGLQATSMETDSDMSNPFAHGYLVGAGDPIDVTRISASAVFGNGNLVSTPLEVARFYRALQRGDVVSPKLLPQMLEADGRVTDRYGMGVFRFDDFWTCGTFVGHDGQTPGYDDVGYTSVDGRRQFVVSVSSSTTDERAGDEAAHAAFRDLVLASGCR